MNGLLAVPGIRLGTASARIKHMDRDDLVVIELCEGAASAAVFTQNRFCAAPVILARRHIAQCPPRYLLINSGNANAGTGSQGIDDALTSCRQLASLAACRDEAVLPFSTGVIGERFPVEKIGSAIPGAVETLAADGWDAAARAIMTTDTVPKACSAGVEVSGRMITVTGIAKGAGMIQPKMATMLAFIGTDAAIGLSALQQGLKRIVDCTFNRITVDGDTSTNDACVLFASARSALPLIEDIDSGEGRMIYAAIFDVSLKLAHSIVRDGEGASKFISVEVRAGESEEECTVIAREVANSPLVKTACFASDPNWGRILAALGRAAPIDLDIGRVRISINDVVVVSAGTRALGYSEVHARAAMAKPELAIRIELGRGSANSEVWTCDLSYDYVRINASYRT